jgi:hypothetical protein
MKWPDPRPWIPVDAPIQNEMGNRRADFLRTVLEQFQVTKSPRYLPQDGKTYCNIYVWDCTRALKCEIPHWLDDKPKRRELNANATCDWLEIVGLQADWWKTNRASATLRANAGFPVVATWKNPNPKHSGHVAMLVPSQGPTRIAQAGKYNLFDAPLSKGFGSYTDEVLFWTHQ